jgi:hypothetical protein
MDFTVSKSITKTIQVPLEAFKPLCSNKENIQHSQLDDMEIDENSDFNAAKARTLNWFYPSSIKASKDLIEITHKQLVQFKSDNDMDWWETDDEKLERFHQKWKKDFMQNKLRKIDLETFDVPEEVSEYADEIFDNMHNSEHLHLAKYGYMKSQSDVNEKMRAILVDWLIEVHFKFKLLPETLFISINIIDRYLEIKGIKRQKLQLLGVTAMWIACKYEEIYAPEIKDFVYITDNAYEQKDILQLEYEVLRTLQFNVTIPSSFRFLERYAKLIDADTKTFNLAWYLVELPLIEYKMLKYKPSMISSAALFVAMKILKKDVKWNERMNSITSFSIRCTGSSHKTPNASNIITYSEQVLRPWAKDLWVLLYGIDKISLKAVKKKFSDPKFDEVALILNKTDNE